MRLCEHDGAFNFAAYAALNSNVSWEETQRITAAIVIIGDERADYSEWRAKNKDPKKRDRDGGLSDVVLSLDDYKRELDAARGGLAAFESELAKHRRAVALNQADGRMDDNELTWCEQQIDAFKNTIALCELQVSEMVAEAGTGSAPRRGADERGDA
jgi:hypothetical protein